MHSSQADNLKTILLVSTPWPFYSRPSIQLGALKAYLKSEFPELGIKALHLYLKVAESIGYRQYHEISESTWLAESIYAALLFPERINKIKKIYYREARGKALLKRVDFSVLTDRVKEVSEEIISRVDWGKCSLVGFSICLCQLTSSLYFIRRIKEIIPDLPIVVGGSVFAGENTRDLIETFSEIDFVVNGEGELPLSELVGHMKNSAGIAEIPSIPGVVARNGTNADYAVSFHQMRDLTKLPPPDYDDYFYLMKTFPREKTFFPTLSTESSRGCWWNSPKKSGKRAGCAFCNLNLQWDGYRTKTVSQVVSEIDLLTSKYKILSVVFTDNLLPIRESAEIFPMLDNLGKDLRLFAEIRADTPVRILKAMRIGGVCEVQIGIEALSSRLLKKLNKGTTAICNLEIMKNCEELGILNVSNLIFCFPGSDTADVEETLHTLEFATFFRPLRAVYFWLGLGSPIWQNRKSFGLTAVFNHPNYAALFPPDIFRSIRFMIQSYRGDREYQNKLWLPVKKKVKAWNRLYNELNSGFSSSPILSFRDGRDFLIVRQKRIGGDPLTHRIVGIYRDIYLFCCKQRSLKRIVATFPQLKEDKIVKFLRMMVDKRLTFEENDRYLSLAVKLKRRNSGC